MYQSSKPQRVSCQDLFFPMRFSSLWFCYWFRKCKHQQNSSRTIETLEILYNPPQNEPPFYNKSCNIRNVAILSISRFVVNEKIREKQQGVRNEKQKKQFRIPILAFVVKVPKKPFTRSKVLKVNYYPQNFFPISKAKLLYTKVMLYYILTCFC